MLNVIDIVLAVLILFYLIRSPGGMLRTSINLGAVLVFIIIYAIAARLLIDSSFVTGSAKKMLEESYFTRFTVNMIKWAYPALEKSAPAIDTFVKDKIISAPTPEVKSPETGAQKIEGPRIKISQKELEKILLESPLPSVKKK